MTRYTKVLIAILFPWIALSQPSGTLLPESVSLTNALGTPGRWRIAGRTAAVVDEKGKRALKLNEGEGMGLVWLDGHDFANGVIEVDVLGRSQPVQGSFLGIAFRVVDGQTHDAVYFRPFNFQAADPVRHSHAVQYVSIPRWPWEPLRTQHPGQYERAITPEINGDEWFHVRVVIDKPNISVFVNGSTVPCLTVKELSDRTRGSVGLWVDGGSGGHFANFKVTRAR